MGISLLGVVPLLGISVGVHDLLALTTEMDGASGPLLWGTVSGVLAQSLVFPVDTIRRRLQIRGCALQSYSPPWGHDTVQPSSQRALAVLNGAPKAPPRFPSLWDYGRTLVKHEGARALFRGVAPNAIKAFPAAFIQLLSLRHIRELCGRETPGPG